MNHANESLECAQRYVEKHYTEIVKKQVAAGDGRISATAWGGINERREVDDWQWSVGRYYIWAWADRINCKTNAEGKREFSMRWHVMAQDFYNWDPTDTGRIGLVSPAALYQLHVHGMAQHYMQYGKHVETMKWTQGDYVKLTGKNEPSTTNGQNANTAKSGNNHGQGYGGGDFQPPRPG